MFARKKLLYCLGGMMTMDTRKDAEAQQIILGMHDGVDRAEYSLAWQHDAAKAIAELETIKRQADEAIGRLKLACTEKSH